MDSQHQHQLLAAVGRRETRNKKPPVAAPVKGAVSGRRPRGGRVGRRGGGAGAGGVAASAAAKRSLKINGLDLLHTQTLLSMSPQVNDRLCHPN